jgi:hypothetical protein
MQYNGLVPAGGIRPVCVLRQRQGVRRDHGPFAKNIEEFVGGMGLPTFSFPTRQNFPSRASNWWLAQLGHPTPPSRRSIRSGIQSDFWTPKVFETVVALLTASGLVLENGRFVEKSQKRVAFADETFRAVTLRIRGGMPETRLKRPPVHVALPHNVTWPMSNSGKTVPYASGPS